MKPHISQDATNHRPFAIPIHFSSAFTLFFAAILVIVLCFAYWIILTDFVQPILSGEGISLWMPLAFFVPLLMSTAIVYSLFFILKRFFDKSQYFFIFSNKGIDMAGWQCDWKTMVWFGGTRTMNGKGVIPCWAAKGIDEDYEITLQVPSIRPVSEKLFNTICHEVRNKFSDEIMHLSTPSWKILPFDEDLPFKYGAQTLIIPQKNQVLGECDILICE